MNIYAGSRDSLYRCLTGWSGVVIWKGKLNELLLFVEFSALPSGFWASTVPLWKTSRAWWLWSDNRWARFPSWTTRWNAQREPCQKPVRQKRSNYRPSFFSRILWRMRKFEHFLIEIIGWEKKSRKIIPGNTIVRNGLWDQFGSCLKGEFWTKNQADHSCLAKNT